MWSKEALSQLTPEQFRALRHAQQPTTAIPTIPRDGNRLLSSFAQQRLWYVSQTAAASTAYHINLALRMSGSLDVPALRSALNALVARHESLRTRFEAVDGEAYQRIDPPGAAFALLEHDLSALSSEAQPQALEPLLLEESRRPFDLARGPLIRGVLVRRGAEDHVLVLTMHHIVSDGWSMGVLAQELSALYSAQRRGERDPLPALPIQYADYAAWQRERLQGERLERELAYWRDTLRGAPALLELPTDRKRPVEQDYRGGLLDIEIDAALTSELKALSLRTGTTLFMAVLAAWSVVLSRLSGQEEVVIGTPVANRNRSEIGGLIGFFVNTLALRVRLDDAPTVSELLTRVKAIALSAQEHQELPFEQVVEQVNPTRSLSYGPLFQVMLAWQDSEQDAIPFENLDCARIPLPHPVSKFDLILNLSEHQGRIVGGIEYASSLFDRETVERYAGYLREVLRGMVARPETSIATLSLLDATEYRRIVEDWNATDRDVGPWRPVHAQFEAFAAATPEAIAITCAGEEANYAQANRNANRLAHWLRTRGVAPETRVALCVQRSVAAIETVLGIMKSGGAYVPIDPAYPEARIADMLSDAQPLLVLTDRASRDIVQRALARHPDAPPMFEIDIERTPWADMADHNLAVEDIGLNAEHPAYIIYTSGSTGVPKGVVSRHSGPSHLMHALREPFGLDANTRVLQFASFSFDAFVLEWVMAFGFGGSLHLPAPEEMLLGDALEAFVAKQRTTHCFLTPQVLLTMPDDAHLATMHTLACGGEAVPPAVLKRWHVGRRFFNAYGPTETTALSLVQLCGSELVGAISLPIGRPLANERVYLLDAALQPVPIGATGELYIGGAGVARGYWRRPELTAERFIDSPFRAGDRLYRTGDVCRWLSDGRIDYQGRNDFQVKIRGFRIELGEIEAKLAALPGIKEAVVLAREDVPGQKSLVAYFLQDADVSVETLSRALHSHLPDYMVPSAFVRMDAWPQTTNNKLDRQALPAPDACVVRSFEPPQGPVEDSIARIWSDALRIERIGRHDNFFALGGHSLLGAKIAAKLRQLLRRDISPTLVFAAPTVAEFAQRVAKIAPESRNKRMPRADRNAPLRASFAQQRLWFVAQMRGVSEAYHLPLELAMSGPLDVPALRSALNALVARHESLRTRFEAVDGEAYQRIDPPGAAFALLEHDLSALSPEAQPQALEPLLLEESRRPFDLARGPLIRGVLVRRGADDHVLVLTMHHIVSDGWSMGVLAQELSALYSAQRRGERDPLPALPIQYADYAAWQRERLQGERLERELAYWRDTLRGAPALLELPTDRKRPVEQDYRGGLLDIEIDAALTSELKALSLRTGTTLFMAVLAAWSVVLSRLSGQEEVVIGTPVANRNRSEIGGLIGFFVNTLALRVRLDDAPTVSELLTRVKAIALSAQEHQELPFEQVVEQVNPTRSLSYGPLFQVMFAWQSNEAMGFDFDALRVEQMRMPHTVAKYDLTLSLHESENGIVGGLEYASSLFDRETVERYAGYLREVLRGMVARPETSIATLSLLDATEYRRIVEDWNATDRDVGPWRPVHAQFEAFAAATPEAIAITCAGEEANYAQANRNANRLAHWLRTRGVAPETRVALCVQRSVAAIETVLGIMKSGGAYVPIDPTYPEARIADMLSDAQPLLVLTDRASRDIVQRALARQGNESPPMFEIDIERTPWADAADHNLAVEDIGLNAEHPAYIIYTSGSTGVPKGVVSRHSGPSHLMHALREPFGLDANTRVLQFASFSFDAFVLEWVMAFGFGGSLHLPAPEEMLLGDALEAFVAKQRVTHCFLTPQVVLTLPDDARLATLHTMTCGGEVVPQALVERWHANRQFFNVYGPTETTGISIIQACGPDMIGTTTLPIGRPLANERVYLLDAALRPVPIGATGELYIGGAGVARGYWRRPELTAERFIDSPFRAGDRLYRTGDVCRWLSDGRIDYQGRNDFQVKIRGFRIELGEIEAKLAALPGVKEAVVLAREDVPGQKSLVAYYLHDDQAPSPAIDVLRSRLQMQLPDYMVPAAFVRLEAWPLTSNNKIDRKALPAPEDGALGSARAYVAPRTPIEEVLVDIWRELLGVERIGVRDDFFDLGGHSLLAMRAISAIRDALGITVPLRAFFESPTIEHLGRTLLPDEPMPSDDEASR